MRLRIVHSDFASKVGEDWLLRIEVSQFHGIIQVARFLYGDGRFQIVAGLTRFRRYCRRSEICLRI